jgi:hypothetical protein
MPHTSLARVAQARSFGAPPDRPAPRPHEPARHTLSVAERGRQTWAQRQCARAAQEIQDSFRCNPRVRAAEIADAFGLAPAQDPYALRGFTADTAFARVMEFRRVHHRNQRHTAPDMVSMTDFAYAINRSDKTLSRWLGDLVPDLADDQSMWPRAYVTAVVRVMADLGLTKVKRLSTHQASMLRQHIHQLDIDDLEPSNKEMHHGTQC